ncbi:hypothetical protein [Actinomyces radicidentis]|uniref:hypothetical protein n=1 Tax=Actinomyces radicidentis TaxID=111015 RepID=UPI0028EBC528|nr:hypothetical protein [Actinomyces radicidentis]
MTTKNDAPEYDFDSWTPADEDAALKAAAQASAIRYIIVEQDFVGRFPDGHIIRTPIKIGADLIDKVSELAGDEDPRRQIEFLFEILGQDDDLDYFKKADLLSTMDYAQKYFACFEKVLQVSLGK